MADEVYPYKKVCEYCATEYVGRLNSKFCCPQHKALYHAHHKRMANKPFVEIETIFRNNRNILKTLFEEKPQNEFDKKYLMDRGFDFKYNTHSLTNEAGVVFNFCYDIALYETENGTFKIYYNE